MHHIPRLVRLPLLIGTLAAASLVACTSGEDPGSATEVAGMVLEREAEAEREVDEGPEGSAGGDQLAEGSDQLAEGSDAAPVDDPAPPAGEDPAERPPDLNLLRSGPTRSGTLWLSAAGQWVGLDSQTLDAGERPSPVHLDAIVELDAGQARFDGCALRLVAPADAELEVSGEFTVQAVLEHSSGEQTLFPLDVIAVDVTLAPGSERTLAVNVGTNVELDVELDRRIHCEGRFDRT